MTRLSYLDFHLEVGLQQETGYPLVLLNAPTGQAREFMRSPMKEATTPTLLQELQQFRMSSESPKALGNILFNSLFMGSIHHHFSGEPSSGVEGRKGPAAAAKCLGPRAGGVALGVSL